MFTISVMDSLNTRQEMKDKILQYIKDKFGSKTNHYSYCNFPEAECSCKNIDNIDENTGLISGGYIDSFSMVVVLVWLERTFKIKIPEKLATADNFDTVSKIVKLIG